ncbi:MAG: AhpC/TSA family protein [Cytophagales bacterium]|nr:MAG: AhpC/TSA family protein [Cytophagales bacterium]
MITIRFSLLILVYLFSQIVFAQVAKTAEDISPLLIGEKITSVSIRNLQNEVVETKNIFNKPTVLIVYRGGWCPYCNTHLAEIGQAQNEILNLGYQIVAISPDNAENLKESVQKHNLGYQLFSDSEGNLSKILGIAYEAPGLYKGMLSKSSGGVNESFLPVPAVFVVNTEQEIEFLFINPNYKKRISKGLLLAVLSNLAK